MHLAPPDSMRILVALYVCYYFVRYWPLEAPLWQTTCPVARLLPQLLSLVSLRMARSGLRQCALLVGASCSSANICVRFIRSARAPSLCVVGYLVS